MERLLKRARFSAKPRQLQSSKSSSSVYTSTLTLDDLDEDAVPVTMSTLSADGRRVRQEVFNIAPEQPLRDKLPPNDLYLELEGLILEDPVENGPLVDVIASKRKRYQSSVRVLIYVITLLSNRIAGPAVAVVGASPRHVHPGAIAVGRARCGKYGRVYLLWSRGPSRWGRTC